jgi:hypothetical protein
MSLELVNTLATLGTFLVIAATALAAIVQLHHMRGSNQIAALNELRLTTETTEYRAAALAVLSELSAKLVDPAFRYQVANSAAMTDENKVLIARANSLGNFYESMGLLLRSGLIDPKLAMGMWSSAVAGFWESLSPMTAIQRRELGDGLWENFEYLAVLSQDWLTAHPKGSYPTGKRRIPVKDVWLEADKKYVASLAPA